MSGFEIYSILVWSLTIFVIGIVGLPLSWKIFGSFRDKGYGLSKILTSLLVSYLVFILAVFKVSSFSRFTIVLAFVIYALFNLKIFLNNKMSFLEDFKTSASLMIFEEFLFFGGLTFWSYIRAHQPDINGLEKFMDYGFVNAILRSKYFPPIDMWFATKPINYYWFGHFLTAFFTKLTNIPSSITYNLMLGTILGFSLSIAFSFISNLVNFDKNKLAKLFAAGIISACLLNFGGNFHTPYYGFKLGFDKYWYPDATRFIGYNPDVDDKTIHEFPIYSYVVSDLHGHLLDLPVVLLFVSAVWVAVTKKKFLEPQKLLVPGFLLGIMFMTNTWDFANYSLLMGFAYLLTNIYNFGLKVKTFFATFIECSLTVLLGIITAVPFMLNFESIAQGVKLVHSHTPLWQLAILWGFPAVLTALFTAIVFKFRKKIILQDIFVFALLISGWVLIALPEIIYVQDIYIASHYRANTMFKLTYQAFVMFYLSSGYIAVRTLNLLNKNFSKGMLFAFYILIFGLILIYPSKAINSYYADLKFNHGLDGEKWLQSIHPEDEKAIDWLRKNASQGESLLEAPGDSYTEFNAISSYTGIPTVSGWFVHEWLWRGSADAPQGRVADIQNIYLTTDSLFAKNLLAKYGTDYVIVGPDEKTKFPELNEAKFKEIGKLVFSTPNLNIYKIN